MIKFNSGIRSGHWLVAALFGMAVLAGCGGGAAQDGAAAPAKANTAPAAAFTLAGMVQAGGADADAKASIGSDLVLNAGASSDADGDTLGYKWSIASKPAASTLALPNDSALELRVRPDLPGTYVFALRVTDSKGVSSDKSATVEISANSAPVQNVAFSATFSGAENTRATQALTIGSALVFDGAGATDADGDAVTVTWTLIEKPAASAVVLAAGSAAGHLVADAQGLYKLRARGTDAHGAYSDTLYVFNAANKAPQVLVLSSATAPDPRHAGTITTTAGYIVALDGAGSTDIDGDQVSYAWTLISKPDGSTAALSSTNGQASQITPDLRGTYEVKLTATDAKGASATDITTIVVNNTRPAAGINSSSWGGALLPGTIKRVPVNATVTLNGGASTDADGDALSYSWSIDSKPWQSQQWLVAAGAGAFNLTVDVAGVYKVRLRATDSAGAFAEQVLSIYAGNDAPIALVDRPTVSVAAGSAAKASAARSFDDDGDTLTYAWEIDARPSGSVAAIAAPASAALSFTPDLAGTYIASVTVSDGKSASVAYVVIKAIAALPSSVALPFAPLAARYSKTLDKLVLASGAPDALKIVDPFTGVIKTVLLPHPVKSLNLSADGKLAAVLHEGALSLVQLETATLLRTSLLGNNYSEAFVTDAGMVYLAGQLSNQATSILTMMDGRSGIRSTPAAGGPAYAGPHRGIFAPMKNRAFLIAAPWTGYGIKYFDLDGQSGALTSWFAAPYNGSDTTMQWQFFLSEGEEWLFSGTGDYFRTDSLQRGGRLANIMGPLVSLSHSAASDETLVVVSQPRPMPNGSMGPGYSIYYQRYLGAGFTEAPGVMLPTINGAQSYAVNVFHSANSSHVALVQTGTQSIDGVGASYFLLVR